MDDEKSSPDQENNMTLAPAKTSATVSTTIRNIESTTLESSIPTIIEVVSMESTTQETTLKESKDEMMDDEELSSNQENNMTLTPSMESTTVRNIESTVLESKISTIKKVASMESTTEETALKESKDNEKLPQTHETTEPSSSKCSAANFCFVKGLCMK